MAETLSPVHKEIEMNPALDCRTCENYMYHSNSGSYCYNEEHWRKRCVSGDQYKPMQPIKLWSAPLTPTPPKDE